MNEKRKLIWISDFFVDEIPTGGAELCDNDTLELLSDHFEVQKIKSINIKTVDQNAHYIISNFTQLSPSFIDSLIEKEVNYSLYEHDHKYCVYRNPFRHNKNLICDCFNYNSKVHMFYFYAQQVFCQTDFHRNVIDQNVYCNTVNLGSNLWNKDEIEWLKICRENKSDGKFIIFSSPYPHKNTQGAVDYAQKNNLEYKLISGLKWKDYIETLSKSEGIIFFPILAESASRLAFEARALNKKVITNKLVGYTWEPWWKEETVDFEKIINSAKEKLLVSLRSSIPKISIFCTTFNSEKYIKGYLENVASFKFPHYEVIIYDGGSTDNTVKIIKEFIDSNDIQEIIRLYENKGKIGIYKGWNRALSKCKSNIVINMNADDRFSRETLSELYDSINKNDADFVYADSFITNKENETFEKHTKSGELNWPEYDKELLKKMCFGSHYPAWNKKMLFATSLFEESMKSASDWWQWIKFSEAGFKFKKLNKKLGLYYFNPEGMSTTSNGASNINATESNFIRSRYAK